jgi:threonine 3-dehydrogenase
VGPLFVQAIANEFGIDNVIASDVDPRPVDFNGCKSVTLDVCDHKAIEKVVRDEGITYIVHLAAILSALGEKNVDLAYKVNVDGTTGILNIAKDHGCKVYMPSSIAVFGGEAFDRDNTDVDAVL